jgi:hypothetical protein
MTRLEPGSGGAYLAQEFLVALRIKRDALAEVLAQERADPGGVGGRQQVGAEVFGANGIGFLFLKLLALFIAADGHGKREADDQAQKRERGAENEVEVSLSKVSGSGRRFWMRMPR